MSKFVFRVVKNIGIIKLIVNIKQPNEYQK